MNWHYEKNGVRYDNVTEEDINAKFENGILTMYVPKEVKKPQVEEKFITIE